MDALISPSAAELNNQRTLISRYQHLQDLAKLIEDQRRDTRHLISQLSSRKAALLSSRRHRQEYISDQALIQVSEILDLDAEKEALKERDRRLVDELGKVLDEMDKYAVDESSGYFRLHREPAEPWWKWPLRLLVLLTIICLTFIVGWRCPGSI